MRVASLFASWRNFRASRIFACCDIYEQTDVYILNLIIFKVKILIPWQNCLHILEINNFRCIMRGLFDWGFSRQSLWHGSLQVDLSDSRRLRNNAAWQLRRVERSQWGSWLRRQVIIHWHVIAHEPKSRISQFARSSLGCPCKWLKYKTKL